MTQSTLSTTEFPREQYLNLLHAAQELFATQNARAEFLSDLTISIESSQAAQPQETKADVSTQTHPPESGVLVTPTGIDLGTAKQADETLSPARFARALVDELARPENINHAITLARRIANRLPDMTTRTESLVEKLQHLLRTQRIKAVQAGESPDLATYQRWLGFECAHEFSLSDRFFGREKQLTELDKWIADAGGKTSLHCICALGGSGKSALAWQWLSNALPQLRSQKYEGAFWCSFYEKNFNFETFQKRLLRFAGEVDDETLYRLSRSEIEDKLIRTLERTPIVVVIDGLERLMNGYAVTFDRAVDPDSVQGGKSEDELSNFDRQLTDLRDGAFLRRLARKLASKILITTRLQPADLEETGSEAPLSYVHFSFLEGLDFPDLAKLWDSLVPNCPLNEELEAIFKLSGNHPLVVSILARSVAKSGGNWAAWTDQKNHLDYRPDRSLSAAEVRAHLIGICMRDLNEMAIDVLGVLTTSGKPMELGLITQILLRGSAESGDGRWQSEEQVEAKLAELVELGLIGLAEQADPPEYDVHPVVRGATWNLITNVGGQRFLTHALSEFMATPSLSAPDEGLELNKATSLMRLLVQTGEIDRAWEMYFNRLFWPLTLRSENRTLRDLFELLLPDGNVFQLLPLKSRVEQGNATYTLGHLLMEAGDGIRSEKLLRWTGAIRLQVADFIGFLDARRSRTWQTIYQGKLFETECALQEMKLDAMRLFALQIIPGIDVWIGIVKAIRGQLEEANRYFSGAEKSDIDIRWWAQGAAEGWVYADNPDKALALLDRLPAWRESDGKMQLAWERLTRGMALFQRQEYGPALDELAEALQMARRSDYTVIQCFALTYIAEIQLERGQVAEAEKLIDQYLVLDPNNQYKLSAADAWRVRARCRLARNDRETALAFASQAYILAASDGPPFTYAAALYRAREIVEQCGGYVPTTRSQVDPRWRTIIQELNEEEVHLVEQLQEIREEAIRRHLNRVDREQMSAAQARKLLQDPPFLETASLEDRQWWRETTRDAPPAFTNNFMRALDALEISLARFREEFEASDHKSFEVLFHQLRAEKFISPHKPRPVQSLNEDSKQLWLKNKAEHQRALEKFLDSDYAKGVGSHFLLHQFGRDGMAAFLIDNKRRMAYEEDAIGKAWWESLEEDSSPEALLILSQCIVFAGATLGDFVREIAIGTDSGIVYAFEALRVKRSIERLKVTEVSKTEGWSDTQVQVRLEDVKRQIAVREASEEAQRFWRTLAGKNHARRVLQLAEELALRDASLEDYFEAYLFSNSDHIEANLAYVDYARLRQAKWDPKTPWPAIATLQNQNSLRTDVSGWAKSRLKNRVDAMLERLSLEQASEEAKKWWKSVEKSVPLSALMRIIEELDFRFGRIEELYRATVDGNTENIPAAMAYLEVSRYKQNEQTAARERASALNREGNRHYEKKDFAAAIESYKAAIREGTGDAVYYTNAAWAWLARTDIDYSRTLAEAQAILKQGLEAIPKNERILKELKSVENRSRIFALGGLSGSASSTPMLPLVTPVALEIAANLIPYYENNPRGLDVFSAMRNRIEESTGVQVPGVRVRGNEGDMPPDSYLIMLNEVPLVMGTCNPDRLFVQRTVDQLSVQDIPSDPATDPLTLNEGAWIPADFASEIQVEKFDPPEFMSRHIERVLLNNLAVFCDHTQVKARLEDSWNNPAREILADPWLLTAFTQTLQALLKEFVPTTAFELLSEQFLEKWSKTKNLDQTVAALRLLPEITATLPGKGSETRLFKIDSALEDKLVTNLRPHGDKHILALAPELTQEFLAAVRDEAAFDSDSIVLVCEDPILRPYMRLIVELEFPHLFVITVAELPPERLGHYQGMIRLDDE